MRIYIVVGSDARVLVGWSQAENFDCLAVEQDARLYKGDIAETDFAEVDAWLHAHKLERMFEACYLPVVEDVVARRTYVRTLFAGLSNFYDGEINKSVNATCYDTLLQGISRMTGHLPRHVLDFGCGPGTVLSSEVPRLVQHLKGFDFASSNRALASERGLGVLTPEQLEALPNDSFDAILSAFVLHYETLSPSDIATLGRVLKKGGIWAGNFHKDWGMDWFKGSLLKCACHWQLDWAPSPYGQLVFARRLA
ncbi:class I SAM-dependent methyltransferase [Caenimonas soli]|uniref:class I SAM-dependent methyltransferase n=1 Tax=Caenimonas soli TaxID=2735555 RepID=UPI0015544483|nr:class I SAM-dependent methyltransferase [Caenimonas soli]NPC57832.1 class I SAM-dependent methyltransferase [Caenimonas soli]